MISAGTGEQIRWGRGNWIFLDIGFSTTERSCGLLIGDGEPEPLRFSEAQIEVKHAVSTFKTANIVIEAPLSVCFDASGNPIGRSIEKEGKRARYWYVGPGCAVMVASMYFVQNLIGDSGGASIRLFEGFVSYKGQERSSHQEDVLALRRVVQYPSKNEIYEGEQLRRNRGDDLFSAFRVIGLDCGVPAVIKPAGELT